MVEKSQLQDVTVTRSLAMDEIVTMGRRGNGEYNDALLHDFTTSIVRRFDRGFLFERAIETIRERVFLDLLGGRVNRDNKRGFPRSIPSWLVPARLKRARSSKEVKFVRERKLR